MAIIPIRKRWKSTISDREQFNGQMHYEGVTAVLTWNSATG
jgi:hypothetical protein